MLGAKRPWFLLEGSPHACFLESAFLYWHLKCEAADCEIKWPSINRFAHSGTWQLDFSVCYSWFSVFFLYLQDIFQTFVTVIYFRNRNTMFTFFILNCFDRCCSKGGICGYSSNKGGLEGIFSQVIFRCAITQVVFSCDGVYVAVTTVSGLVAILTGSLESDILAQFQLKGPSRVS